MKKLNRKLDIVAKNPAEYGKLYQRWRYHNDAVYRQKMIDANIKFIQKKEQTDSEFKKKRRMWALKSLHKIRYNQKIQKDFVCAHCKGKVLEVILKGKKELNKKEMKNYGTNKKCHEIAK